MKNVRVTFSFDTVNTEKKRFERIFLLIYSSRITAKAINDE